jgi:HD-GYP domain-containing protein (c-di-GMP phosphodiesterase class II)
MADEQSDSRGEARQSFFAKQQLMDLARTVFQLMSGILKNATLYPESHPMLLTSADKLRGKIDELLIGRDEVPFYLVGGELFFEKISIPIDQSLSLIMEHCISRDVGGISFKPGLNAEEIIRFSGVMNRDAAALASQGGISEVIAKENISHIELHRVLLVDKNAGASIKAGKQQATQIFNDAIDSVKDMVQAAQLDRTSNMKKMNTVVQSMVDNVLENRNALLGLTNIKMYDEYTFAHSVNVSILAVSLGTFLALDKPQVAALGIAGMMHDIGKVNVPVEIINKPGKLTEEEWEAVKRHPIEGALLLARIPGISKLATVAAFEHHQHDDDRGYPQIAGPLLKHPFSQVISLVDAYDAITAPRIYYSTQTPPDEGVRVLLKKRGSPFNPVLVNAFVKMIGIFPIGTILKLNTGEVGVVMQQTSDLLRPRVLILTKFDGSEKENGTLVSLLETVQGQYRRSVVGTINPGAAKIDVKKYLD